MQATRILCCCLLFAVLQAQALLHDIAAHADEEAIRREEKVHSVILHAL